MKFLVQNKIQQIFDSLNKTGIQYCHWKSNAHLDCSFESRCDFDLLVASDDAAQFMKFLTEHDFKKKFSSANYVYPGFDDYFYYDNQTGNIFHFHIHFKLIIGRRHQKNYRIAMENVILSSAVIHSTFPIKIIAPEIEMLLLFVRSFLKFTLDLKTLKRMMVRRKLFPLKMIAEYEYLQNKINQNQLNEYCRDFFEELQPSLKTFLATGLNKMSLTKTLLYRKKIIHSLKRYKIYSRKDFRTQKKIKMLSAKSNLSWLIPGGSSFAFIGVDGAGKSTTIKILKNWLDGKISYQEVYMGLPKGNKVWEFYRLFFRIFKKLNFIPLMNAFDNLRNVYNAKVKYRNYITAEMAKNQGKIILFDRYPIKELWNSDGSMDGPGIKEGQAGQKKELQYYNNIKAPDYIFVLITDSDDAISRKSEHKSSYKQNQIIAKNDAVYKLLETNKKRLIPVNTSRDRDDVILDIKSKIWSLI